MEDLEKLFDKIEAFPREVQRFADECLIDFRRKLREYAASRNEIREKINNDWQAPSPQQTKKRAKCLSLLEEEVVEKNMCNTRSNASAKSKVSIESQENIKASIPIPAPRNVVQGEVVNAVNVDTKNLMPPPAAPIQLPAVVATENNSTLSEISYSSSGRPQRAAKLKSEKCLKEPKLKEKLRRPSNFGVVIKKENEQRESQMHLSQTSINTNNSDESVVLVPGKPTSMVILSSDNDEESNQSSAATGTISTASSKSQKDPIEEESAEKQLGGGRQLRVKIKREKISLDQANASKEVEAFKAPPAAAKPKETEQAKTTDGTAAEESTNESNTMSASTASVASNKKASKKKVMVRPIKVERFSDLEVKASPIASRTRKASCSQKPNKNIIGGGGDTETAPLNDSGPKTQKSLDSNEIAADDKKTTRSASIYEDAIESPPPNAANVQTANAPSAGEMVVNETFNVGTANDATFCTNQPAATGSQTTYVVENDLNSTVTLKKRSDGTVPADMTFDVCQQSEQNPKKDDGHGHQSFETAKNVSMPNTDSLITEDESIEQTPPLAVDSNKPVGSKSVTTSTNKIAAKFKGSSAIKTLGKFPANRAKELFNPSAQSPVKMRVEAFESVAASSNANAAAPISKNLSRLKKKENAASSSNTTPIIGKLQTPVLGRFLTPTQTTNIPLSSTAAGKKLASSASKATMPLHKSVSASSLKLTTSSSQLGGSSGAVRRENSADDIRRALLSQAEERKKQREQKNKMAAMAREAKERERAARLEKIKQEREEKRLKREQEMEKKRQLDEINRKLREEEEAEMEQKKRELENRKLREQEKMAMATKLKAKQEQQQKQYQQQEQMKPQTMPPPAPKVPQSKYTFEMLDEYDSTDDEDKTSYKRPPPPTWSRRHVRVAAILMQQYMCTNIIDNFFSVQPMTPDLKAIFPNIDARYLKRNSSAFWTTPPRYSELPKY